jgi:hypothetical protein
MRKVYILILLLLIPGLLFSGEKTLKIKTGCSVRDTFDIKIAALACHRSQKEWLDASQGFDSYLKAMEEMAAGVGRMAGGAEFAEGWQRHNPIGLGPEGFDPLAESLAGRIILAR